MGSIEVTISTTDADIPRSGYLLFLAGPSNTLEFVSLNDTVVLSPPILGTYTVQVPPNCTVGGDNPRIITVTAGATARATFEVTCS